MRVALLFLAYAFAFEDDLVASPTDDPEDMDDLILLDEYSTSEEITFPRALQEVVNATNLTIPEPGTDETVPLAVLALVGLGGAGAAGFLLTRVTHTYETYDYAQAAESGLLEDPDYEVEYDDGSDEYYE
jgi:hypothetical protein